MNKRSSLALCAGCLVAAAAVAGSAGAASPKKATVKAQAASGVVRVHASLDIAQVTPAPTGAGAGASGKFTATLEGSILRYTLSFKGLSGIASSAEIRTGARKVAGPIAQPLCVPCFFPPETGVVPLTAAQIAALRAGRLYVSVETAADPDGEIRGQLTIAK